MKKVTLDTTMNPNDPLVTSAVNAGHDICYTSVTSREASGADFKVKLCTISSVPEVGVWGESSWGARWADEKSSQILQTILGVISTNSFPRQRNNLSDGEKHQLRDALILEAHISDGRDTFVSDDERAFVKHGKRQQLQRLFNVTILTHDEYRKSL